MADSSGRPSSAPDPLIRGPRQDRSRRTLRRILDASIHILEHEGPDALIVTTITKRARASVGSFYARFRGKEDLLRYVGEDALTRAVTEWAELRSRLEVGSTTPDLRRVSAGVVEELARLYLEGAGRPLVLLHGIEDPAPSRRTRLEDQIGRDLEVLIHMTDLRPAFIARVVSAVLYDVALAASRPSGAQGQGSPHPPTSVLIGELVELTVGYLGGEVRPVAIPIARLGPASRALVEEVVEEFIEETVEEAPEPEEPVVAAAAESLRATPAAPPAEVPAAGPAEEPAPAPPATEPSPPDRPAPPKPTEPNPFDVWG